MNFFTKGRWQILNLCILTWLLCFSTPAHSVIIASSEAMLKWDTLSISYSGTNYEPYGSSTWCTSMAAVKVDYPYNQYYESSTVYQEQHSNSSGGPLGGPPPIMWFDTSSSATNSAPLTVGNSIAYATNSALYAGGVASIANPTLPGYFNSSVQGMTQRDIQFELGEGGNLTISADYWLSSSITSDSKISSGLTNAFVEFALFDADYCSIYTPAYVQIDNTISIDGVASSTQYKEGTLSWTIPFSIPPNHGGLGWIFIYSGVDNELSTNVPEPATMLLFGFGLVGLIGFRRKIRK